jgi:hypothetical protein
MNLFPNKVTVYVKKQLRLDRMTFRQQDMLQIGVTAVESVKGRIRNIQNANDAPALKLTPAYRRRKQKRTGRTVRDLSLTGKMLANFQVRTVTPTSAQARNTTRLDRIKAAKNNDHEKWIAYSPKNITETVDAANLILKAALPRMVLQKQLKP